MDKLMKKLLTVDTGKIIAWVLWNGKHEPEIFGCFRLQTPETRLIEGYKNFRQILNDHRPKRVIIEGVQIWDNSQKSHVSAVSGDLFQLSYLCGVYMAACIEREIQAFVVPVSIWKGQLTKHATATRVNWILGETYPNEHITDAVGMGLALTDKWVSQERALMVRNYLSS